MRRLLKPATWVVSISAILVLVLIFAERVWNNNDGVIGRKSLPSGAADLASIIELCNQQFSLDPHAPQCRLQQAKSVKEQAFVDAIWEVWKGRTEPARKFLDEASKDWAYFKEAAHLRFVVALATEDYRELRRLHADVLQRQGASVDADLNRLRTDIELQLASLEGDWKGVTALLSQFSEDVINASPELLSLRLESLAIHGDQSAIEGALDSASQDFRRTRAYALMKASRAGLKGGSEAWLASVRSQLEQAPNDVYLELELRLYELLHGDASQKSIARSRLLALAEGRSVDVRFLYRAALPALLYREPEVAARIGDLIATTATDPNEFVPQYVFEGGMAAMAGDYTVAGERLQAALSISPEHYWANYFNVLLARRVGDELAAYNSLVRLLRVHPYNQNLHAIVDHFASNYADVKWVDLKRQYSGFRMKPTS
jgi:hypothetical protein